MSERSNTALALPAFSDFAEAFDLNRYRPVPDTWWVAVSDVVDSTVAIARGRYKDVNMAGAATIAAVLNASGRDDLPFAYGGDGGVVLLPPELETPCRRALSSLQCMCAEVMGLTLRCSLIPVAELKKRGRDVLVAAHDLGSGRLLAMLAGGGCARAEALCKSQEGGVFAIPPAEGECDLAGLSCRWEPLKSERGVIMALVVQSRDTDSAMPPAYRDIYARIAAAAGPDASPVKMSALSLRWPPQGLQREAALLGRKGRLKRAFHILFEVAAEHYSRATGKTIGGFNAHAYHSSLPRHSDYRKYADSLRMVIDCSEKQADAIVAALDVEWRNGAIDYGTYRARAALMTCFVRSSEDAGHVHFIDAEDGGYALAALDMKRRNASKPV